MQRFGRMRSLQKFAAIHSPNYSDFSEERTLTGRDHFKETRTAALTKRRDLCAA